MDYTRTTEKIQIILLYEGFIFYIKLSCEKSLTEAVFVYTSFKEYNEL